jgi:hypothetical protein
MRNRERTTGRPLPVWLLVGVAGLALAGVAVAASVPTSARRGGPAATVVRIATDEWGGSVGRAAAPSGARALLIGAPEALASGTTPSGGRFAVGRVDRGVPRASPHGVRLR